MVEMFDKNQSGGVDFTEFAALYAYIQDMKKAFNEADSDKSRGLNMQQVQSALSRVHGPLIAAGGAILIFTLFKIFDKKKQGKLDWPNFLKMALHLGKLRTGFEHTSAFQQSSHPQNFPTQQFAPSPSPMSSGQPGQQTGFGQPPYNPNMSSGQPGQNFSTPYPPPQQQGFGQQNQQSFGKRDVNPFEGFLSFANNILGTDMRR